MGGSPVRTISTRMGVDAAVEVTASKLRLKLMFPADQVVSQQEILPKRGRERGKCTPLGGQSKVKCWWVGERSVGPRAR